MKLFKRFVSEESGLETVEYAVMTALIVAALVTAIASLSTSIGNRFGKVQGTIDSLSS